MKISVCIPTYNQSQYITQAITSAYNQTLKPFEIIVSDDKSTDYTLEMVKKLSEKIPILKIISQPKNLGITYNTDECLRKAEGDYIVRLDSDDYLAPNYIEKLAAQLIKYPKAGYAHAAVQEVDQNGNFLNLRQLARKSGYQDSESALQAAIKGYRVSANILMFRKEALIKVNFLYNRPSSAEDYHLSASLADAGFGNVYLNETLGYYRVWVDAGKVRLRRKLMEIVGIHKVYQEVLEPAFKQRKWNIAGIKKNRTAVACIQSDCLSWNVYSYEEKLQLKEALEKLSPSSKSRSIAWLYFNGYGRVLNILAKSINVFKSKFKKLYIKLRY